MDLATFRSQLAPQWNPVTIAITAVLFLFKWPLGVAMAAYVIWGQKAGLNLARPQTFVVGGTRLGRAISKALSDLNSSDSSQPTETGLGTGKPDPFASGGTGTGASAARDTDRSDTWHREEAERLRAERELLDAEKAAFAREKMAWETDRKASS